MKDEEEEDDLRAIRRLKKEIAWEKMIKASLRVSVHQWQNVVREILNAASGDTKQDEEEWRIRCHYQRSFNEMLQQKIKDMKREIRVLRRGEGGDVNISIKGDLRRMSLAECRLHTRHLEADLTAMKSLRSMYDRQLDQESMEYAKIREKRTAVLRDIFFLQKSCMRQQENYEKEYFAKFRDQYGGDLFRTSEPHLNRTHPDLTTSRQSSNISTTKEGHTSVLGSEGTPERSEESTVDKRNFSSFLPPL